MARYQTIAATACKRRYSHAYGSDDKRLRCKIHLIVPKWVLLVAALASSTRPDCLHAKAMSVYDIHASRQTMHASMLRPFSLQIILRGVNESVCVCVWCERRKKYTFSICVCIAYVEMFQSFGCPLHSTIFHITVYTIHNIQDTRTDNIYYIILCSI